MSALAKLLRAVEEEFGQTAVWKPVIRDAKREVEYLTALAMPRPGERQ